MKEKYIKSPLNYVGGKYKLLNQIIPLFPNDIDVFVDLFGGGFNVGINVNAEIVIYNDSITQLTELLKYFYLNNIEDILHKIDKIISEYKLDKDNPDGYLQLREYYNNENKDPVVLYTLICYAFNNQMRFNSKGEFNMPFGKRCFNPVLRKRLIDFISQLHKGWYGFLNCDFRKLQNLELTNKSLVYCDPPYYNSIATYNENGGWTEQDERDLLNMLDILHNRGIKFALSNNLKYDNPLLAEWKDKYNVHYLDGDYRNCNYQKKDKSKDNEVLITNY